MSTQDAVKARIKKLESDMLGLLHRLQCLSGTQASSVTGNFNTFSKPKALPTAFADAIRLKECLQQQILCIREELHDLQNTSYQEYDLTLAA